MIFEINFGEKKNRIKINIIILFKKIDFLNAGIR